MFIPGLSVPHIGASRAAKRIKWSNITSAKQAAPSSGAPGQEEGKKQKPKKEEENKGQ